MPSTAQTAIAVVGIDIGNSFHIVGLGQVEARLRRGTIGRRDLSPNV